MLGQAELVVIDEAAAIPLPLVKNLIGPYLVFMASTVNGYEGTGRSLSLKLISNLRDLSRASNTSASSSKPEDGTSSSSNKKKGNAALMGATGSLSRSLAEIKLDAPIRYGPADPIEKWLNSLLCLDATISPQSSLVAQGCPHPSACELFAVDRDTLFSYHPASEMFLQRMMALYVSSHYKNSPNDLQLMSDAPGHRLFVLLPPLKEEARLPEPLVVMQVAMEGNIARQSVLGALSRGVKAGGDLIPWTMSQQVSLNTHPLKDIQMNPCSDPNFTCSSKMMSSQPFLACALCALPCTLTTPKFVLSELRCTGTQSLSY